MKKIVTLLLSSVLMSGLAFGQAAIPNGDFENYNTSGSKDPTGWATSDDIVTSLGLSSPGSVIQDTLAANVYSGTSSVRLTTKSVSIPTIGNVTFAGSMSLGKYGFNISGFQVTLGGNAYTDRPDSVTFAYKYDLPVGALDSGVVKVILSKATANDGTVTVGSATVYVQYQSNFTIAKAKINYYSALTPDTLKIQAQSSAAVFMGGTDGAQLNLDALHFVGLDTTFKVYTFPSGVQNKCLGDTISLRTDDIAGDTYAWYLDGTQLPYTTYKIRTGTAGNYTLVVTHNGGPFNSDTVPLIINPLPVVTYTTTETTICDNIGAVQLTGATPAGGNYSGQGVSGGVFTPSSSLLGDRTITYTYTDNNGCTASASSSPYYVAGCSLGVDVLQVGAQINVYPNPAFNTVYIKGDNNIIGGTANMYDVQGRLINTIAISSNETAVSLTNVSAGWYVITIADVHGTPLAKAKIGVAK